MSLIQVGQPYVFGVPDEPVTIPGVRVRCREHHFAVAFVRTGNGIRQHYVRDNGKGKYSLGVAVRASERGKPGGRGHVPKPVRKLAL